MMASKDDNKHKYVADGAEEEAEKAPLKKQKTIGDDGDDDNGNDSSSFSSSINDDDYSSKPDEGVSSEEEMNLPTDCEEELLIRRGHSNDRDIFDDEEESQYFPDD
jgi:hypothetical protein